MDDGTAVIMADIEQIKDAIDLRDLISKSCKLDSSGRGAHENKHGSESGNCLYVNDDGWYCHHCHAGGDALSWIMDRDNMDFPDALQNAAEIAGIPLTSSDPAAEIGRRAVFDVLKAAAVHFNENLTDAHRADISAKWGITDQTIDDRLIGIARNDEALEAYLKQHGFTRDQMLKSGLFFDWSDTLKPHFQGRYVFPYWKSGTVRYMIARQTDHTPKGNYEAAKYKKLLTHSDKRQYVSEHVRNDTLYGVDSLRGVSDWCMITEGVTDCIMAMQAGIPCISPVTVRFRKEDHNRILKLVKRFDTVYICNDNEDNEAGLEGAIGTAEYLEANAITTRLVTLPRPDGVEKIDLAEYLRDHDIDEFKALFDAAASVWSIKLSMQPVSDDTVENVKTARRFVVGGLEQMDAAERVAFIESDVKAHFGLSDDVISEMVKATPAPNGDMSSTDRLIELGKQDAVLFHTPDDTCYAAIKLDSGGSAIYPLDEKSRQFKKILKHRYYNTTGKAPTVEPMKAAIGVLESIAAFEGETIELHNRVAWHNANICYDLTNTKYEAIEITTQGWDLMAPGHILFRRFGHQIPQARPVPGGDVWRLYEFANVPKSDQLLDMVYLISCLVPGIPHPISITTGEHGSTKTTAGKMKKALIDPSDLDVIALQPNEERMVQMLYHHWFIIFDNVTYLQQWQSDVLCRACTGEGTVKRTLYTNEDDTIFKYKRCIGLNGINNAATKPDLLDRAFFLNHEPIPKDCRIEERVLFERFNKAKPGILGGMFDALSRALRIYPTIKLKEKPRMADFAVWGCAIAEALDRDKQEFLDAYYANIGQINREALAESVIGGVMLSFMEARADWEGTPTQLHNELEMLADAHGVDVKSRMWAKTPRSLGKRLRLILPNLREEGVMVEISKSGNRNIRIVNTFNHKTQTSKTSKTSTEGDFDVKSKRPQTSKTSNQTPTKDEFDDTQTPKSHKRPTNVQEKSIADDGVGRLDVLDVSAESSNTTFTTCGKCDCELSGQTFQGPAGLGMICAVCQAELDRQKFAGGDLELVNLIKSGIYKLGYVKGIHEFTAVEVLMEMPKGTGATTEKIGAHLDTHAADMKIERIGDKWRKVSA